MKEYIERAAILQAIEESEPDVMADYGEYYGSEWGFSRSKLSEIIRGMPAADVAPVEMMPRWVRPEMALPAEDTPVLVIASGRPVHETTLDHAVLLAKWYPVEGWILEEYPSYEKPRVHFWAPIPELPEEARV